MKKKILSAILSFAMLFSVVASVGSVTASATIADGIVWGMVFEELMTENPAGDGTGPVENSYELRGYPNDSTWISGDPGRSGSVFTNYSEEYGFTEQALRTNGAELIVEESPLYNSEDNTKVRIEFGFASKEGSNLKANIDLVGSVGGETVTTSRSTATERFIFVTSQKFYYDNPTDRIEGMRFSTSTCYKITIDIDCETDTYDVYINGELQEAGVGLAYDFDAIYGVGFYASAKAFYVDDIRYYTVESTNTVVRSEVILNTNDGEINSGDLTEYTEGVGAKLPTDVTKAGYEFAGWYDNAEFTGDAVTEITEEATGAQTFYAKWLAVYSVTLETNGGTVNADDVTEYTEGEDVTLPTNVTKGGYAFLGWYDNESLTGDAVEEVIAPTGDLTFYAKWEKLALISETTTWEDTPVFEELMTENPAGDGTGPVENSYELNGYPDDSTWISGDPGRSGSEFTNYSEEYGFTDQALRTNGAELIVEASPLYNSEDNTKVRIEFGFASKESALKANINLVGSVDGETVTTSTSTNNERFIFVDGQKFYYDNPEYRIDGMKFETSTCYKFTIDIDCEAGVYDVYVNDEIAVAQVSLPYEFDAIYGVGFSASSKAFYVDDIRYYTEVKDEGLTIANVEASYTDGAFAFAADVTGYTSAVQATVLVGLFDASKKLVDVVETSYATIKANGGKLVINTTELANPGANATVGVFAWDMETLVPLALSQTASIN